MNRLNEPEIIKNDRSWRLGRFQLEHQDRGSKWSSTWNLHVGERYRAVEFGRFQFALSLMQFSENSYFTLMLFGMYIKLPWRIKRVIKDQILDKWGFTYIDDAIQLSWGHHSKIIYMPWDWQHIDKSHQAFMADQTWVTFPRVRYTEGQKYISEEESLASVGGPRWKADYPYHYMLRSGEVQQRTAAVTIERRVWRRRGLPEWLPLFQKRKTTIDIRFDKEVGERTGSWKGGTLGCSYEMKPGERPVDTLRRMERDRRFT